MKKTVLVFIIVCFYAQLDAAAYVKLYKRELRRIEKDSVVDKKIPNFGNYLTFGVGAVGREGRYGDFDSRQFSYTVRFETHTNRLSGYFIDDMSIPKWITSGFLVSYVNHTYKNTLFGDVAVRSFAIGQRNTVYLDEALQEIITVPKGLKTYVGFDYGYEFEWADLLDVDEDLVEAYIFSSNTYFISPFIGVSYFPIQRLGAYMEFSTLQSVFNFGVDFRW